VPQSTSTSLRIPKDIYEEIFNDIQHIRGYYALIFDELVNLEMTKTERKDHITATNKYRRSLSKEVDGFLQLELNVLKEKERASFAKQYVLPNISTAFDQHLLKAPPNADLRNTTIRKYYFLSILQRFKYRSKSPQQVYMDTMQEMRSIRNEWHKDFYFNELNRLEPRRVKRVETCKFTIRVDNRMLELLSRYAETLNLKKSYLHHMILNAYHFFDRDSKAVRTTFAADLKRYISQVTVHSTYNIPPQNNPFHLREIHCYIRRQTDKIKHGLPTEWIKYKLLPVFAKNIYDSYKNITRYRYERIKRITGIDINRFEPKFRADSATKNRKTKEPDKKNEQTTDTGQ